MRVLAKRVLIGVLGKFGVNRIEKIFTLTAPPKPVISEIEVRQLSEVELLQLDSTGTYQCKPEDRARVASKVAICFGAFIDGELAGIGWYALQPYHHSGGLYVDFSPEWICGYGSYVLPNYRRQGVRKAIVQSAFDYAKSIGRKGILAAIDWHNEASLKGGERMGYQAQGYSVWCAARPIRLSPLYALRFISSEERIHFPIPTLAFITPFLNLALEVAYTSTRLKLVIDCGSGNRSGSLLSRAKQQLKQMLGRDISLKHWADRRGIPYVRYEKGSNEVPRTINELGIEQLISYAAPLLPSSVFCAPSLGSLNLHPSLLPAYRGGRPLFWQIFDGNFQGGVTLHRIDDGIDTGEVVDQVQLDYSQRMQRDSLGQFVRQASANVLSAYLWNHLLDEKKHLPELKGEQSSRHFAKNTTMNTLLGEHPLDQWPIDRMVRVYRYLGFWPKQFGRPAGISDWIPFVFAGYEETNKPAPPMQKGKAYYLSRPDGWVEFRPVRKPKALLKHALKHLRSGEQSAADFFL